MYDTNKKINSIIRSHFDSLAYNLWEHGLQPGIFRLKILYVVVKPATLHHVSKTCKDYIFVIRYVVFFHGVLLPYFSRWLYIYLLYIMSDGVFYFGIKLVKTTARWIQIIKNLGGNKSNTCRGPYISHVDSKKTLINVLQLSCC